MKMIKIEDDIHKMIIPHTVSTGKRRTIGEVIKEKFTELPNANLRAFKIDDYSGQIMVAEFYLCEDEPNANNISAEICLLMEVDNNKSKTKVWDILQNGKIIEFDFYLGLDMYHLKCDKFDADGHFGNKYGDVTVFSLFIDDYMKYSKKDK